MRWIVIPEPVQPKTPAGELYEEGIPGQTRKIESIGMHDYLMIYLAGESKIDKEGTPQARSVLKIGDGHQGMLRLGRLDRKFKKAQSGEVVGIEEDDWKVICTIIEERSFTGSAYFGFQLLPLAEAWLEAKDEKEKALAELRARRENGTTPEPNVPEPIEA